MELSHDEVRELIAPYVLGALPADEVSFVRAHILSCDACMAEADTMSEAASKLALSAEPVPPPGDFTARVMASATGTPQEDDATVAQLPGKRRSPWTALVATAAALVIVVLSASVFTLKGDLDTARDQLAASRSELTLYERVVSAVLHSDGGMELAGSGAVGRMVPSGEGGVFVVAGMHEAPKNHTYQLWVIDGGQPISAGLFDARNGVALLDVDVSLKGADGVAVTIEPDGGSDGPTTDPIMSS